jgi:hypothetical protein
MLCFACLLGVDRIVADDFRVLPYLQNPAPEAMTILWFSDSDAPGSVEISPTPGQSSERVSTATLAESLAYPAWEVSTYFDGTPPPPPIQHRVRIDGLAPATEYHFRVQQGESAHEGTFTTAPARGTSDPIRLIFFADSETGRPTCCRREPIRWIRRRVWRTTYRSSSKETLTFWASPVTSSNRVANSATGMNSGVT